MAKIIRIAAFGPAFLFLFSLAFAQDLLPVGGPLMGFIPDGSDRVRPVYGIPGSSTLGQPMVSPYGQLRGIVFAPRGGYALATAGRARRVVLLKNRGSNLESVDLGLPPGAGRIVLSPSGRAAAVHYGEDRSLAVLTGLPDAPSVSWRLQLPDFAGALAALAVSDDGGAVLGVPEGGEAPLFLMTPDLNSRLVSHVSGAPGIAFLTGSRDAVVTDGALGSVLLIQNLKGEPRISVIGGRAEGVTEPVAVAVAGDDRHVFVANREPGGVITLDLAGGEASLARCDCTPTLLEPLGGYPGFRLNNAGRGAVWLFDAGSSPPRIAFVPDQTRRAPARRSVAGRAYIGAEP